MLCPVCSLAHWAVMDNRVKALDHGQRALLQPWKANLGLDTEGPLDEAVLFPTTRASVSESHAVTQICVSSPVSLWDGERMGGEGGRRCWVMRPGTEHLQECPLVIRAPQLGPCSRTFPWPPSRMSLSC